ncbi:MAG: VTT domain-containing protein [Paracoccaceae bacterium]|uniref:DedA family protein n=1 Tax=Pseudothioclava arenosa TaxID=1795308 RepID=A0A2A4CNW4_9RHOB|nr:VTT domain-containing protein [Pseudothioclava arenosa]PCD75819.1 DedA family protein [Pseudothioclava arenosa]
MTETALVDMLLAALPAFGPWLLGLTTFLSCLAIPVPSSIMMIASGAFVASGDLALVTVTSAAFTGAVLGDQTGFWLGRRAERFLPAPETKRGKLVASALAQLARRGAITVFFSRWMFSALGPWVNLAAGASGFAHTRFSLAGILGEAVWVSVYVGLGITFGANLQAAADLASNALGMMAAGALALALGAWLWHAARHPGHHRAPH